MALKTSSEMPVFGLDGIHATIDSKGTLTVFYLESKMTGSLIAVLNNFQNQLVGLKAIEIVVEMNTEYCRT